MALTGQPTTLAAWLAYVESLHPRSIAMGLDRVREVHARLEAGLACPVITVGGTNGKGSTCAFLDAMLRAAGYRVGVYSSPHLTRYNERVRIDGREATDAELIAAFEAVEAPALTSIIRTILGRHARRSAGKRRASSVPLARRSVARPIRRGRSSTMRPRSGRPCLSGAGITALSMNACSGAITGRAGTATGCQPRHCEALTN